MQVATEYVDGDAYITIRESDGKLLAKFVAAKNDSDEYHFSIQTPFTGQTIIHSMNSYNKVEPWRGWPDKSPVMTTGKVPEVYQKAIDKAIKQERNRA